MCAQVGSVEAERMFFPAGPRQGDLAREMCQACPLRRPCLEAAIVEEAGLLPYDRYGIRGGLTAPQRAELEQYRTFQRRRRAS